MVLVKPTARWLGRTQRIPRGRKIERNGLSGVIEVTEAEAKYLLGNFFATLAEKLEEGATDSSGESEPPGKTLEEVPAGQPEESEVEQEGEETLEETEQEGGTQEPGEALSSEKKLVLGTLPNRRRSPSRSKALVAKPLTS